MAPFLYDTLAPSQMRLLRLSRRSSGGLIKCSLSTYDRDVCPAYDAVSYTWGDESLGVCEIEVNGATVQIHRNLWDFLDHLSTAAIRSDHELNQRFSWGGRAVDPQHEKNKSILETTYIWIDQLCINQNSIPEKNEQVQRMASVYQKAYDVIVWLGTPRPDQSNLLSKAQKIRLSGWEPKGRPHDVETCLSLFSAPYWTRLWILQEFFGAPSKSPIVCLGTEWAHWSELKVKLQDVYDSVVPMPDHVENIMEQAMNMDFPGTSDLHLLLARFGTSQACEDPRDRVYGLLALTGRQDIQVDYSKPASHVYWDAIASMLKYDMAHWIAEYSNTWLFSVGQSMGVTGREVNAVTFGARDNRNRKRMEFVWPTCFRYVHGDEEGTERETKG